MVSRIRDALPSLAPAVPWEQVVGLRNAMIHGYDRVKRDVVWDAATQDVPALRAEVEALLARLGG